MKFVIGLSVALLGVLAFSPTLAHGAITLERSTDDYRIIIVRGDFDHAQDIGAITASIKEFDPHVVTFDSPGGNIYAAMALGRFLRQNDIATVQTRSLECASACSLAFIGGTVRMADPGSIGVHQSSFADDGIASEQVSAIQDVTSDVLSYLREMGVDSGLLETALRYGSNDIRYLSASEMAAYRVTTGATSTVASHAPPTPAAPQPQEILGTIHLPARVVDVRSAPGLTGQAIGVISNGTRVSVLEVTDNWYRISINEGAGYVPASAVKVDGFYDVGSDRQFIQVLSLRSQEALNEFLGGARDDIDVYQSVTGWFAITLKGSYPEAEVKAVLEAMKARGDIPGDSFATYGNTYQSKLCCD